MNETLIEALNAYTTTLEQKVSALEQRVAQLEGFWLLIRLATNIRQHCSNNCKQK